MRIKSTGKTYQPGGDHAQPVRRIDQSDYDRFKEKLKAEQETPEAGMETIEGITP